MYYMSALCGGSTGSNLYAFIKYYSTREAQKAQQAVNGKYMLDGRLLRVRKEEYITGGT